MHGHSAPATGLYGSGVFRQPGLWVTWEGSGQELLIGNPHGSVSLL